jgi:FixJ family two-component response regulator
VVRGFYGGDFFVGPGVLAGARADVPTCLVLDVQLPGLSGLDVQQELAKADVQIPIIFFIGHVDISMSVRAMKAGALEFLTKSVNDEDLMMRSSRQLRAIIGRGILKRFWA